MLFGPLHISILDIYKVFEPLVCCLKGICVHPYTVTPAKLAPDLGFLGCFWSVKMVPLCFGDVFSHNMAETRQKDNSLVQHKITKLW